MTPGRSRTRFLAHDLDTPGAEELAAAVFRVLPAAERERVLRLHLPSDRTRSTIARWLARRAAADLVGEPWTALRLARHADGRPRVEDRPELSLSIAHSGRYAMAAVAVGALVGIDTEQVSRVAALPDSFFLTPAESAALPPAAEGPEHRAALWVLKEAAVKLTGEGLRGGLRRIGFEPRGECLPYVARTTYTTAEFRALRLPGGYVAAVGVSSGTPPHRPEFVGAARGTGPATERTDCPWTTEPTSTAREHPRTAPVTAGRR
ncbi:phosphopantetheinyl transferase [Kitasatospora gansuensis]|uniref:Phosphopantetheinyl transferase n=1 Tax=Kitasatospora gansuensis TaxID=258050 RepID=A0A7W7SDH1_9ACTN|nr:4'-phosphopantetheinyl transferase superfamily protein [Kitasatospora gansuensis]MBB4948471.1 phosphopantetheinyl transferase [Kitasatospora gansuensis]